MAKKKVDRWMQRAVPEENRGKATRKAEREGLTVQEWARKHAHSSNPTTRGEAQFAMRAKAIARGHKRGTKRVSGRKVATRAAARRYTRS